ncbi:MAG TPA: ribosome-associated translation inhibitor RaiA [Prolixibacteraceae bacterium]|jgi:ribosomal subunit interface protein
MNIQVKTVHFTADQKLIDFVNKKVSKLDTFFEGIIGVEVIMKVDKPETANNKIAEIKLSIPGYDYLFAEKQADSFEESLDVAIEAIRRQLAKFKEKLKEK